MSRTGLTVPQWLSILQIAHSDSALFWRRLHKIGTLGYGLNRLVTLGVYALIDSLTALAGESKSRRSLGLGYQLKFV